MDNCVADHDIGDSDEDLPVLGTGPIGDASVTPWIPIGRGERRADLEEVVARLRVLWAERYAYRIAVSAGGSKEQYQLLVRHL